MSEIGAAATRGATGPAGETATRDVASAMGSSLACRGCGWQAAPEDPAVLRCPQAKPGDGIDHVIVRRLDPKRVSFPAKLGANPFIRYRQLFHAYHAARAMGCSDADYVARVRRLDRRLVPVAGHGFRTTPFNRSDGLSHRLGFEAGGGVIVKDETGNVSGSHKARHLMGTLLELDVADAASAGECGGGLATPGTDRPAPLAIASCGNAALAAAVVARAAGRSLEVFIPPDADPAVVSSLRQLGAHLEICERQPGVAGDPTYHRLLQAIDEGAVPFTCQGNLNGLAIEGGATLGYEMVSQLQSEGTKLQRLFVQVGGGALASSAIAAFEEARALGVPVSMPRIHAVQTRGAYPLARAYRLLADRLLGQPQMRLDDASMFAEPSDGELETLRLMMDTPAGRRALTVAARHRSEFMWPWEAEPHSIAHGILDDETYDWLAVVEGMLVSGGYPVVVDEATLEEANQLAFDCTGILVDHTGSSGLAGLLELLRRGSVAPDERVAVLFTGIRRSSPAAPGHDAAHARKSTKAASV